MPGSYARRTGEKIYLRQTSIFVATDTKRDQSRSFLRLSVDHTEGSPRQRDNDAVILYLYVEPDAFSHACGSAILNHRGSPGAYSNSNMTRACAAKRTVPFTK